MWVWRISRPTFFATRRHPRNIYYISVPKRTVEVRKKIMKRVYRIYRIGSGVDYYKIEQLLRKTLLVGLGAGALIGVILTTLICITVMRYTNTKHSEEVSKLNTQITNLSQSYDNAVLELDNQRISIHKEYEAEIQTLQEEVQLKEEIIVQKDKQIEEISNSDGMSLSKMRTYIPIISHGNCDNLTLEHLVYLDNQCKTWNVNPSIMVALYDLESDYRPEADNAKSSARGLGQVLESTARSYWTGVLGHGSYSHSQAYDPYVNIEITTSIVGRNLQASKGATDYEKLYDAIYLYGDQTSSYWSTFTSILNKNGVDVVTMNPFYN